MTVLLFDQNLSFRLPELLVQLFPNAEHVRDVGLGRADDLAIWEYAAAHGAAIVTKDDDFRQLSFLRGAPPKVVWVHLGNCRTSDVVAALRARRSNIRDFLDEAEGALLVLRGPPSTAA